MTEEHKHEYLVHALPIVTARQRQVAAQELEKLLKEGWLPASGFMSLGTMPKDHTTWLMIMARDKK